MGGGDGSDVPGLSDAGQDVRPGWEAHPGGQERALGLRSHGYWAMASLARTQLLFLGPGLRHQIRCCSRPAPLSVAGVAPGAHPAFPTAPAPHRGRAGSPQRCQPQAARARTWLHPTDCLFSPQHGSHWVKNPGDQTSLSPCRGKPGGGGEAGYLICGRALAVGPMRGDPGSSPDPDPQFLHSFSPAHWSLMIC